MGSQRSKIDRISNLPDSLLMVILSLLPFESAVRTSALSKRWTPLCMSLSNLRFDDLRGKKSGVQFNNSVDRFLMHRPVDLNIQQLGLIFKGDYDPIRVNQWIRKGLEHQMKDLSLNFYFRCGRYELLSDIYTSGRSVEALRLKSGIVVDIPNDVSFSNLKVLEFTYVKFSSYESIEELLLSCPVLEDLVFKGCEPLSSSSCLTVCGSALKNLTLENNERFDRDSELEIVIDTPGLETLRIEDSTWAVFFVECTLLSLRTAHINLMITQFKFNDAMFELFDHIYHVKFLTLDDKAIGALDCASSDYHFPTFHNLIQLELIVDNWSCWNLLANMIARSPNLQCLSLPFGIDLTCTRRRCCYGLWNSPELVPECLSSNFKKLKIGMFHGTEDEFSFVDYFLLEGKVLRKITIYCAEPSRKSWIRKEVLKSCPKTCKINVS